MNWYVSKIIFQIISGNGDHAAQFDEQLRLIRASDEQSAFFKAEDIGKQEEQHFENSRQQAVIWKYIAVSELYQLEDLNDGAELHYHISEAENSDEFIALSHQRAAMIKERICNHPNTAV